MKRVLAGLFFAVVLGLGAGVGTYFVATDLNIVIKAIIGATICGFFLGMAKGEIPNEK